MSETYTLEYFREQVAEFIGLCGETTFWVASQRTRDNAVHALWWVYLRCPDAELPMIEAAIVNYTRRELHMLEATR